MTTTNQEMSVEEIERIVAQQVANAIEAIAIYESINQTKQRENKVAGNASNKRKCNFHHIGQCAEKCGICKRRGHQARDCRIPVPRAKQRSIVSGKKAKVICYGCGVNLPPNGKTIGSKWLFKKKTDMDGAVHTYKARLVAKGYTQTPGIDYKETFSHVADIRAIRILIAIAASYDYEI
nr:putative retrotransposon Ty1-copia subclass protein [Tanacetum cinerariifolium]